MKSIVKIIKSKKYLIFLIGFLFFNDLLALVQNAQGVKIQTDSFGKNTFVIWSKNDSTNNIIQACFSMDYSANWSVPINLSALGQNANEAQIVQKMDRSNIYAIWKRSNGVYDIVQFSSCFNYPYDSWTSPQNLSENFKNAKDPKIILNTFGNQIAALWLISDGSNDIVQFRTSSYFGQNWSTTENLSDSGLSAKDAYLAADPFFRNFYAIWTRSNGVNDIVQFRSSKKNSAWDPIINLSASGQNAKNARVFATLNNVSAIWARSNGSHDVIQFTNVDRNVNNWRTIEDISDSAQTSKNPQITADKNGLNSYATWARSNGINDVIQVRHLNNDIWSSTINLSDDSQNAKSPQIICSEDGRNIYVVWLRYNGSIDVVQVVSSKDYGVSWSVPINLSAFQNAKSPKISVNDYGDIIYIVWTISDGSKDVVQISYSLDKSNNWSPARTISD